MEWRVESGSDGEWLYCSVDEVVEGELRVTSCHVVSCHHIGSVTHTTLHCNCCSAVLYVSCLCVKMTRQRETEQHKK